MTLTQEAIRALVGGKRAIGMSNKEIEDYFKDSFNASLINIDLYTMALLEIYSCEHANGLEE
ncbi:MAG: hypothetical protein IJI63_03935 [Clostridiales bacterium]|nr:hypothetical protein [Clostridiales bacterium]